MKAWFIRGAYIHEGMICDLRHIELHLADRPITIRCMTKRAAANVPTINSVPVSEYGTRTVYRVVNGKRKKFTLRNLPTDYTPTPNTIGYKIGRVKNSNGKVDPTMILGSHK